MEDCSELDRSAEDRNHWENFEHLPPAHQDEKEEESLIFSWVIIEWSVASHSAR